MSPQHFDVHPESLESDSHLWTKASQDLSRLGAASEELHLDSAQLSFASTEGLASAYAAVVQQYARLVREGSQEASRYSEALGKVQHNYVSTDTAAAEELRSSGQGLTGGGA